MAPCIRLATQPKADAQRGSHASSGSRALPPRHHAERRPPPGDRSLDRNEQHHAALGHHPANAAGPRPAVRSRTCLHLLITGSRCFRLLGDHQAVTAIEVVRDGFGLPQRRSGRAVSTARRGVAYVVRPGQRPQKWSSRWSRASLGAIHVSLSLSPLKGESCWPRNARQR